MSSAPARVFECAGCHQIFGDGRHRYRCSRCEVYCGKECQAADWPRHKTKCTPQTLLDVRVKKIYADIETLDNKIRAANPMALPLCRPDHAVLCRVLLSTVAEDAAGQIDYQVEVDLVPLGDELRAQPGVRALVARRNQITRPDDFAIVAAVCEPTRTNRMTSYLSRRAAA